MKKNYSDWTKDELIKEIDKLDKRKKYGVSWEPKKEKVVDLCKNELPVLFEIKNKSITTNPNLQTNLLLEGDNYHTLSVLNYTHKGKVDIIYIDPPYNRGGDFIYNDKIVDRTDSYRHSKWLSFMNSRLVLAKDLLKENGVIFISIDENEFAQFKLLCDEIFNDNLCGIFVWQKKYGGGNDSGKIATEHEYILSYTKISSSMNWLEPHTEEYLKRYSQEDEIGRFFWDTLERPGLNNPIEVKIKFENRIYNLKTFRSQKRIDEELKSGEIRVIKIKNKVSFQFKQRLREGKKPRSILRDSPKEEGDYNTSFIKIGSNSSAKKELINILGDDVFDNPKPTTLIKYLISLYPFKNPVVLDFFAGSGTTGQAVLDLNKKNNINGQFILCTNNENNICTDVCYPRIMKIIKGYTNLDGEKINGLKGNLRYFKTDFVRAEFTDFNKKKLVEKSTEMLCLKENTFNEFKKGNDFRIFMRGKNKYLGIIYDDNGIEFLKKEIKKLNKKFIVYVFSLDDSAREEEFEDIKNLVELKPIPAVILNIYKRIFK